MKRKIYFWGSLAGAVLFAILLACNGDSPSGPDPTPEPMTTTSTVASTTPTEPTNPTTPTPPSSPNVKKLEWGEPKISGDRLCIPVRNPGVDPEIANLLSYDLGGLFENGKAQKLLEEKVKELEPGTGANLCVILARCYQWDLLQGPGEAPDPYTPPDNWEHFGYVYLDSDIEDDECKPPPPPPGCPDYKTRTGTTETEVGMKYTYHSTLAGQWLVDGQPSATGKVLEITVPYCEEVARVVTVKFIPDGTPPGLDCSTSFTITIPECEKTCEDFDITMKATGPELTETEATYLFEVFVDGQLVDSYKRTYPRKETGYSETECYVAQPTNDLRCEVCVTVKIPPTEPPTCDDFETELLAEVVSEDETSITYEFEAILDGQTVKTWKETYQKGRTPRTETECYVFTPTDDLRCEVCVEVEIPPYEPPECIVEKAAGCYSPGGPIGNPTAEAAWLGENLTFIGKDENVRGFCFTAMTDADVALAKFANRYKVFLGVSQGDLLCIFDCFGVTTASDAETSGVPSLSHVSYFECIDPD